MRTNGTVWLLTVELPVSVKRGGNGGLKAKLNHLTQTVKPLKEKNNNRATWDEEKNKGGFEYLLFLPSYCAEPNNTHTQKKRQLIFRIDGSEYLCIQQISKES
jgi:hypothetical protein